MSLSKKITFCAAMSAIAIVFGYIETLIPLSFSVPGIKLGLANLAVIICLYLSDKKTAWAVMLVKVLVTSLLFSSPQMLVYSLFGGILSLAVMQLMQKLNFNIVIVSIGGGVFHNIGQLAAAVLMLKNINFLYYAPILISAGAVCAAVIGITAKILLPRIKKIYNKQR